MLVSSIGCLVSGIATSFTPWFELFVVLRVLTAAFSNGAFLSMFVYGKLNTYEKCVLALSSQVKIENSSLASDERLL